ncbi:DUF4235 domain-containing protein [Bifidobacterium platyrrhinorum]|uniref:DUF4235 domain-containing protein n=1 Tax=Bifidobacterium platyrrhinorum TaxID=2661628 RepID=A0A6L9SRQ5_9BIFI|nr:DUF4235 domain-containing protein [Bifidobacterium platyrrhinorum]NEG55216.1 DUF4235 domain-containing protein [Bifidobacterium platyrrhinorum]
MSDETHRKHAAAASVSSADRAVEALHRVDEKVDALREQRMNDPESLGDKLLKWAVPSLAGLIGGKLFQLVWNHGMSRRNVRRGLAADAPQGVLASVAFSVLSAAFGALVSQLSDRGSKAIVDRRHRRRDGR